MIAGILENKYLADAIQSSGKPVSEGMVEWECPSNIALIKYWGKKPGQLPVNPSLSFTLAVCITRMNVRYDTGADQLSLEFTFNDKPNLIFHAKMLGYLQRIIPYLPFLKNLHLKIDSSNTFPHSSGIASSASSFGALALALCSIEQEISCKSCDDTYLIRKASFLARLGSGSASRSLFGGAALWGETTAFPGSSDEEAIPLMELINKAFAHFKDTVLVVDSVAKEVPSSVGHKLMEEHPFAGARIFQANRNLIRILDILKEGDLDEFIDVVENEALTLHALMLSSNPGYLLMRPGTIGIIEAVRHFRHDTGIPVGFTLDAGANVHLLYAADYEEPIRLFIKSQLVKFCREGRVIDDYMGNGPVKIT